MGGLLTLAGLAAFIFGVGAPLYLMMSRIHARARSARVSPLAAHVMAFIGYLIGVVLTWCTAIFLLTAAFQTAGPPGALIFLTLLVGCSVGSAVGSLGGYIWIWFRTTKDADYDDSLTRTNR
jgi:hypothetical protein